MKSKKGTLARREFVIGTVAVECFGGESLGKILALIVMGYSIGQWVEPWIAGESTTACTVTTRRGH